MIIRGHVVDDGLSDGRVIIIASAVFERAGKVSSIVGGLEVNGREAANNRIGLRLRS